MDILEYEKYVANMLLYVENELQMVKKVNGSQDCLLRALTMIRLIKDHKNNYLLSQHIK